MAHILIVTFHRGFSIDFPRHIDHTAHRVSYLTDAGGGERLGGGAVPAADLVVADPGDAKAVLSGVERLIGRRGRVDVVCAPSEWDLVLAARLRERFGVPGPDLAQTLRWQDKVQMKSALQSAGLPVPAFAACHSKGSLRDLVAAVGFPLVLKPRRGAASKGVMIVRDVGELREALGRIDLTRYEAEEFVAGPIHHLDGLVQDGGLRFSVLSRYVNTCLQSAHGLPHGSVVVDDAALRERADAFGAACLAALGLRDSAFHMELILRDGITPTFLEIGARPGGAEVQQLMEDLYGVDLLRGWVELQLGPIPPRAAPADAIGGWLVVPAPRRPPYVVTHASADEFPHVYSRRTPAPGDVHDASTLRDDRWPGGRFRYRGPSTAAVQRAIAETIAGYGVAAAAAHPATPSTLDPMPPW